MRCLTITLTPFISWAHEAAKRNVTILHHIERMLLTPLADDPPFPPILSHHQSHWQLIPFPSAPPKPFSNSTLFTTSNFFKNHTTFQLIRFSLPFSIPLHWNPIIFSNLFISKSRTNKVMMEVPNKVESAILIRYNHPQSRS